MVEAAVVLDREQRRIVTDVVREHCLLRGWRLHATHCRTNHCHVVLTAAKHDGEQVRNQLKSWSKRALKDQQRSVLPEAEVSRERWWTKKGSVRYLFDVESLDAAVDYVLEAQG